MRTWVIEVEVVVAGERFIFSNWALYNEVNLKAMTETPNETAAPEAPAESTSKKRKGPQTKSKGHSYVPGKSCIQLGQKHNYVITKSKKSMRCTKCGSTRWLGGKKSKAKKGKKAQAEAQSESSESPGNGNGQTE